MKRILLTMLLFAATVSLFSQTDTTTQEINTVTVTAYRADLRTPVTFKNIEASDISKVNVGQEPAAILNYTPSVTATSDAGNSFGYSYFRLRGIDQTRINMTLDGIPLNEPEDQGVYFNNYPDLLNSVSSIQVQRGVGTSNNGASAFGGAINFESKSPFAPRQLRTGFGYGSYSTGRLFTEYNTGLSKKGYGAYVRLSTIATDGYVDNAFHWGKSAFYSVGRKWNQNSLKLTGFIGNQRNGQAWLGATQDMLDESATSNGNSPDEQDDFTTSLTSLQFQKFIGNTRINATTYYSYNNGNYDINLNNLGGEGWHNIALLQNYYGGFVNVTHYLDDLNVTYGVHGNQFDRRHTGTLDMPELNYVNTGFRQTFSAFAKANYEIGKFRLYADVQERLTSFTYDGIQEMPTQDWAFFNYRGGANYEISNRYSVYYSYGQTSREPTRNDLFRGQDNLDYEDTVTWPDDETFEEITPEQVQDHEFGFKFNSGKLAFQANGYFMSFENEITLAGAVGPNGLTLSKNVDNSYRAGLEIDLAYQATDRVLLLFQLTQSENKILEGDEEFNHVLTPNTILNLGAEYQYNQWGFAVTSKYQGESYLDLTNQETIDAFNVINFRVAYTDGPIVWTVGVNNLTNQKYNASGYTVDFDNGGSTVDEVRYYRQAPLNFFTSIVVTID